MKVKVLGLVAGAAVVAAVSFAVVRPNAGVEAEPGSLTVEVRAPSSASIAGVTYTLTGPSSKTGVLSGSKQDSYATKLEPITAGGDYTLLLRSTEPHGAGACQGSAQFGVIAGQDTSVSVKLYCPQADAAAVTPARQGAAVANRCPRTDAITAVASTATRALLLTGIANDPDNGPGQLSFHWTAEGAQLADATEAAASLACNVGGQYRVKLEVSDGACTDVLEQTVTCTEALANAKPTSDSAQASGEKNKPSAHGTSATTTAAAQSPSSAVVVQGSTHVQNSVNAASDPPAANTATGATSRGSSPGSTDHTTSSTAATAKPAPAANQASCAQCEAAVHDGNRNCVDSMWRCDNLAGLTDVTLKSPLLPGVPKAALCRQIINCIHSTRCAEPDQSGTSTPTDCYCGQGVDAHDCYYVRDYAGATGACKELIAIGSESLDANEIAMRMFDPTFAAGAAETVIETCDVMFCARECL